ncbi:hypothetical protein BU15DRAFT_71729 [Melanogaster broomeanus]|nr:hypothetical protein BU15DRAFT_71729 [Melanogaster broomeanus]
MSALEPPDAPKSTTNDDCSCPTVSCDDPSTCRPSLPRIKSCLKTSPSHSGASTPITDPASICPALSSLAIRSPPKPYSSVFLAHVPIPLLPLNPVTISASPSPTPFIIYSFIEYNLPDLVLHHYCHAETKSSQFSRWQEQQRERSSKPPPAPERPVVRPHNIPVPPPPVVLRSYTHPPPPPPSSTQTKPTPIVPPKRKFTFLPLLDDSSKQFWQPISSNHKQQLSAKTKQRTVIVQILAILLTVRSSQRSPRLPSPLPRWQAAARQSHQGLECDFHRGDHATGKGHLGSRNMSGDDSFVLNLDLDADVDPRDSYFPRVPPSMAMHPIHPPTHTSTPPQSTHSRVPISAFHSRHPHINLPRSSQTQSTRRSQAPAAHDFDVDADTDTDSGPPPDPMRKLRLHAIPSPDLDLPAPSPLELPGTTRESTTMHQHVTQKRMLMSLVPLAEPGGDVCTGDGARSEEAGANHSVLFGTDERGLSPSLSRVHSRTSPARRRGAGSVGGIDEGKSPVSGRKK